MYRRDIFLKRGGLDPGPGEDLEMTLRLRRYGYRVRGPYRPWEGPRANPAKILVDPYALRVTGAITDLDAVTASAEERARRRYLQLKGKVDGVSLSSLLDEIRARDERDTQRAVAPLKPAADAIQLDSTELSIEQVLERIMSEIAIRDIAG